METSDQQSVATKENFSYENLRNYFSATKKHLYNGDYVALILPTNKAFIGFTNVAFERTEPSPDGKIFKKYGLKFHISLPEMPSEDFSLGWDIICSALLAHQVASFKVIKPGLKMSDNPDQRGKEVTVYADANPEKTVYAWAKLFNEITQALTVAKVPPGYRALDTPKKPEKILSDSNYVTYRYI